MLGIIYKVTNLVNDKVYIGQTTKTLEQRKKYHINSARVLEDRLQRFGEKYNDELFPSQLATNEPEIFKWEIIDYANTREGLNEKERYWIKYYIDNGQNMYNVNIGGHYTFKSAMFYNGASSEEEFYKYGYIKNKRNSIFCGETIEDYQELYDEGKDLCNNSCIYSLIFEDRY